MVKTLKKVLFILILTLLTGCAIPGNSPEVKSQMVKDISEGIFSSNDIYNNYFNYYYDMDFDGNNELISINVISTNYSGDTLDITLGNYNTKIEGDSISIEKVYVCDMNTSDNVFDIAVITTEMSDDPRIHILKYSPDLEKYNFEYFSEYENQTVVQDCRWLGYAKLKFDIDSDGIIHMNEQTNSYGMWTLDIRYKFKDNLIIEMPMETYDIPSDHVANLLENIADISYDEKQMSKQGYLKAQCDFTSGEFSIRKGEYFKPLYDNNRGKIYLEKQNRDGGWIDNNYENYMKNSQLHNYFFAVAG